MYRAFHEATNSRSPAVTTYTRPPSRRTGSSPDATRRYAAARLIPSSVPARGTASSNGKSLNTLLSNLIHLHSAVSLSLRTASRTKLGRFVPSDRVTVIVRDRSSSHSPHHSTVGRGPAIASGTSARRRARTRAGLRPPWGRAQDRPPSCWPSSLTSEPFRQQA